mgnify:CR=1 FL=1
MNVLLTKDVIKLLTNGVEAGHVGNILFITNGVVSHFIERGHPSETVIAL